MAALTQGDWDTLIPTEILFGLRHYLEQGLEPGSFTFAVLTNDLARAVFSAHPSVQTRMRDIVTWVANCVPPDARGSEPAVRAWIEKGGRMGLKSA